MRDGAWRLTTCFFVALHRIAFHSKLLKIWAVFHNQDPSLEHPSNPPDTGWISICGVVAGGGSSVRKWQDSVRGKCDFAAYPAAMSCTHISPCKPELPWHSPFPSKKPWPLWQVHNNWLLALICVVKICLIPPCLGRLFTTNMLQVHQTALSRHQHLTETAGSDQDRTESPSKFRLASLQLDSC